MYICVCIFIFLNQLSNIIEVESYIFRNTDPRYIVPVSLQLGQECSFSYSSQCFQSTYSVLCSKCSAGIRDDDDEGDDDCYHVLRMYHVARTDPVFYMVLFIFALYNEETRVQIIN